MRWDLLIMRTFMNQIFSQSLISCLILSYAFLIAWSIAADWPHWAHTSAIDTDMSFAALLAFLMCSNMSSKWCLYGPSNAASCHAACSACGPPLYSIHSCRLQCPCSSHPLIPQDCRFPHWMAHLYNSLITYICCLVAIHVQCIEHGCPILMTGTDGYE